MVDECPSCVSVSGLRKVMDEDVREEWNEYELGDGTRLYVKLVLADVVRTNELNPIGGSPYIEYQSKTS